MSKDISPCNMMPSRPRSTWMAPTLTTAKDCIRFKRKNAISDSRIALLLARCVAMKRVGIGTGC